MDPTFEALLEDRAWLYRLAVDLVGATDADDLVQDAWLTAIPATGVRDARSWFRTVLRNRRVSRIRSEARRRHREAAVARPEVDVTEESLAERLETMQLVTDAVRGLPARYRQVVLLHYFGGLSVADVGRRLDVPTATVHTRLARAREKLRVKLDGRAEDLRTLLLPLLPSANSWGPGVSTTVGLVGGLEMKRSLVAVVVLVLLGIGSIPVWYAFDDSGESTRRGVRGLETEVAQLDRPNRVASDLPDVAPSAPSDVDVGPSASGEGEAIEEASAADESADSVNGVRGRFVHAHGGDESNPIELVSTRIRELSHPSPASRELEPVMNGPEFVIDAMPGLTIEVLELTVDGRLAVPLDVRHPVPSSGVLEIPFVFVPTHRVRVFGDDPDAELDEVMVIHAHSRYPAPDDLQPADCLAYRERSPLTVTSSRAIQVIAPGYAWSRLTVDRVDSKEYVVQLARGGEIELDLAGLEGERVWCFVAPVGGSAPAFIEMRAGEGAFRLGGIPVGEHRVWISEEPWWEENGPVLAERIVKVSAEGVERIELVATWPEREYVAVHGRIRLPVEVGSVMLELRPQGRSGSTKRLGTTQMAQIGPGVYDWELEVEPGPYSMELWPLGLARAVTIDRAQRIDWTVDDLIAVRVRLVDESEGSSDGSVSERPDSFVWRFTAAADGSTEVQGSARHEAAGGAELLLPPGRLTVRVVRAGWRGAAEFDVTPTTEELVVPVSRVAQGVRVRVHRRGGSVAETGVQLWLERSDRRGGMGRSLDPSREWTVIYVEEPGTYRLHVRGLAEGDSTPEPRECVIRDGAFEEVTIDVEASDSDSSQR